MQKVKHEIEKQADKRRNLDERRPKTLKILFLIRQFCLVKLQFNWLRGFEQTDKGYTMGGSHFQPPNSHIPV